MNALVALCHFCELHGPRTLFCTEALHPPSPTPSQAGAPIPGDRESDREGEGLTMRANSSATQRGDMCEVSGRCVCPGREGPIFFGDEQHGFVFSHTFFIKSGGGVPPGRGFQLVFDSEQCVVSSEAVRRTACSLCCLPPQRSGTQPASLPPHPAQPKLGPATLLLQWLLKACGSRLTELLEGAPTEGHTLLLERQAGQVLIERTDTFAALVLIERQTEQEEEMSCWEGAEGGGSRPQCHQSESELYRDFLFDEGKAEGYPGPKFRSLRHLRQVLGTTDFRQLAWHVLMGNQVILRGADPGLIHSAFTMLKALLPVGCVRSVTYSAQYEEAYRCNFLGLSPDVPIPTHVSSSEFSVLVDVVSLERGSLYSAACGEDILSLYQFNISSTNSQPTDKGPTLLNKIEVALSNENLSVDVVSHCLLCLKEEWMNKVKVLFKFSKVDGRGREDTQKVLALLGATGPGEEDNVRLLKFWMTGLSKTYKSHLMTAVRGGERPLSQ
nr:folliculin-like [Oncorhynchus nerka]